jgi:hypothetical protein
MNDFHYGMILGGVIAIGGSIFGWWLMHRGDD